ncbi:flagellar biosynthetic protein FlhB [Parvibaculum lavamentivorans DS-1]|uniref:Flagellar biosynthetic protein FlhB n=1 Tax=Parvibaculum lavamentivorans (strain DS-1 / DSM 13023 / NCIMB 13966) TaxID=402881 RepID=A7HWA1_PARL1|nr:flagellar biosynthesis protein FlhB [Parvibaculum lavamentivorans]ABS64184.1 flagellar biosynthetic protein FlhB [Parvibaculum lavamentivorans DS-1]
MADQDDSEKTEEPTHRKLEEAHKKGDLVKSQEVSTWFVMIGGATAIALMAPSTASSLMGSLTVFLAQPETIPMDAEHLRRIWLNVGSSAFMSMIGPLAVLVGAALVGHLIQHAPVFTAENMKPKLSKISPKEGLQRLFGPKSLMNLAKGILKLTIVGSVSVLIIWPERDRLALMMTWEIAQLLPLVQMLALKMFAGVIAVMTVVAALDYLFERMQWMKKQRMSIQEVKDEYKQMEGDPTVKAKLRQIRAERGRKRMMAAVPTATVIITNPTHYAVALKYEQGMGAPVVVAKGVDAVAFRIREVGQEHEVPIIENPPLARALHATVDIDQEIQPEHYKAVAEVIGYVMRLKAKIGGRGRR